MKDKIFIATNILIYAQNDRERKKQQICRNILTGLNKEHLLVISTQVMQEYYNIATLKLGLDKLFVKKTIEMFDIYEIIVLQPQVIFNAIDIQVLNKLSFWDSLIVSAARSAKCNMILTEDMNDGQVIDGIKIQSPFTLTLQ